MLLVKKEEKKPIKTVAIMPATQIERVMLAIKDGEWRTLEEVSEITGDTTPSISARLRDLRKPQFGGHTVLRRKINANLFEYKLMAR
jgi:hypothetical protein